MKVDTVRLFDKDVSRLIDVFIPVMVAWTRKTLIPELYEVFGTEHLMLFLDLFAGTRFEVPSRDLILTAVRDADIYTRLAADGDTVAGLASKYRIEEHRVADAYARVAALVGMTRATDTDASAVPPSPPPAVPGWAVQTAAARRFDRVKLIAQGWRRTRGVEVRIERAPRQRDSSPRATPTAQGSGSRGRRRRGSALRPLHLLSRKFSSSEREALAECDRWCLQTRRQGSKKGKCERGDLNPSDSANSQGKSRRR